MIKSIFSRKTATALVMAPLLFAFVPAVRAAGAPVVSTGIATDIDRYGATLRGTVNPNGAYTNAYFEYGTTTSFGSTTRFDQIGTGSFTYNRMGLAWDLQPQTRYYYRIVAENQFGTARGQTASFTTAGDNTPGSTGAPGSSGSYGYPYDPSTGGYYYGGSGSAYGVPAVYTLPATGLTPSSATLNGGVNPAGTATDAYFEYGRTSGLGKSTASQTISGVSQTTNISSPLAGLDPGAMYYYRVVARNAYGTAYGSVLTFVVPAAYGAGTSGPVGTGGGFGAATTLPATATNAATSIGERGATLRGTVNPNGGLTVAWFEYGATQDLGQTAGYASVGSAATPAAHDHDLTGLTPGTIYYYRIAAQNGAGTSRGQIATFRTLGGQVAVAGTSTVGTVSVSLEPSAERTEPIAPAVDTARPGPGDYLDYRLVYRNGGTASLTQAVVTLVLPDDVEFVNAEPPQSSVTDESATWVAAKLGGGEQGSVRARLQVKRSVAIGTKFPLIAVLSYIDPSGAAKSVSATITLTVVEPEQRSSLGAALTGSSGLVGSAPTFWLLLIVIVLTGSHFFYHMIRDGRRMRYAETTPRVDYDDARTERRAPAGVSASASPDRPVAARSHGTPQADRLPPAAAAYRGENSNLPG